MSLNRQFDTRPASRDTPLPGSHRSRRYAGRLAASAYETLFLLAHNAEAGLPVSIAVIILTMVMPAVVLTAVIWIFVRASRRDPEQHERP